MAEIGYALSSEEHPPSHLVRFAQSAEDVGFTFALISDHFHPWLDRQGHSPFAWTVIGAIAQATSRLRLGTGVTCPTVRYHPAIVAQAAATAAALMPGRFFLGIGSGENLNRRSGASTSRSITRACTRCRQSRRRCTSRPLARRPRATPPSAATA
jgi:G6PDH family F420-dependent oxidoreductase